MFPTQSPYAQGQDDEFKGYVLTQQHKYAEAGALFEQRAKSESASADERNDRLTKAAQLYMRAKQFEKAARAAETALEKQPNHPVLLELAGQSSTSSGRGEQPQIAQLVQLRTRRSATGRSLQILLNSYYRLNDRQQMAQTWEMLLRHYPKPEYWRNVLQLRSAQPHSKRVDFYYLALKFDVGMLDDPMDYETLALGAIDLGLPEMPFACSKQACARAFLREGTSPVFDECWLMHRPRLQGARTG